MTTTEQEAPSQFSIFEGDLLNRIFLFCGVRSRRKTDIFLRILIVIGVTWGGMALCSARAAMNLPDGVPYALNFFYDFAAYIQFFVGIPLYMIAERVIGASIRGASQDFHETGVIRPEDMSRLDEIEARVAHLRTRWWPEVICIAVSYYLAFMAFGPELVRPHTTGAEGMVTWHVYPITAKPFLFWTFTHAYTGAGLYATFVALPIQTYIWVRWVAKISMWYWYLRQVSTFKLELVASHPDATGGIGFLSEVQGKFALLILAYGMSGVVAVVGYKIAIEHAPLTLTPLWGLVLGFVIGAPLLFLAPLLLFTKQLGRTKRRALAAFREKATFGAKRVEERWLHRPYSVETEAAVRGDLQQLDVLTKFYDRIHGMRVVPFDLKSAGQLVGSAVAPLIPLIPYFFKLEGPWKDVFEALLKWLPGH
jgi:hypothetical protein